MGGLVLHNPCRDAWWINHQAPLQPTKFCFHCRQMFQIGSLKEVEPCWQGKATSLQVPHNVLTFLELFKSLLIVAEILLYLGSCHAKKTAGLVLIAWLSAGGLGEVWGRVFYHQLWKYFENTPLLSHFFLMSNSNVVTANTDLIHQMLLKQMTRWFLLQATSTLTLFASKPKQDRRLARLACCKGQNETVEMLPVPEG